MIFPAPVTFAEAMQALEVRSHLATSLGSYDMQRLATVLKERALFSARMTNAQVLDRLDGILGEYIDGRLDLATARLQLRQAMSDNGIFAEFDEIGTIKDFQSHGRLNLILQTNAEMAAGYGSYIQGQAEAILDQWPAQELFRAAPARVARDWASRWQSAGGEFFQNRMIALKNAPIWETISRFGTPYPPFDYGSHMRTRDVDRDEAIELGLIDRDTVIEPESRGFNDDLEVEPEIRSDALRAALEESGYSFDEGVLSL